MRRIGKRIATLISVTVLSVCLVPMLGMQAAEPADPQGLQPEADRVEGGNIWIDGIDYSFNFEDNTATVENYNVYASEVVVIRSEVEGYKVTAIGEYAFDGADTIKRVIIPSTIKTISKYAFRDSRISSITFEGGGGLETIGEGAFFNCKSLSEITIPASVTSIDGSFNSSGLSTIAFESGCKLEYIGDYTFAGCGKMSSITIPASVKTIGSNAFQNSVLTSISFEQGSLLESIGERAFYQCHSLKQIEFPANLMNIGEQVINNSGVASVSFAPGSKIKTIGENAFLSCSNIKEVVFPASLESIGNKAFRSSGLTSMSFEPGSRLTTIEDSAFGVCESLTDINIPPTVTSIGSYAFNMTKPAFVIIPASVKSIGMGAFQECKGNPIFHYAGTEEQWNEVVTGQRWKEDSAPLHFMEKSIVKATLAADGSYTLVCSAEGCEAVSAPGGTISRPKSFQLSAKTYTYDGKAKKPAVTVKDALGEKIDPANYTVKYSNNTKAGKATATVTFKGDYYSGTKSLTFTIAKAANPLSVKAKTAKVKYSKLKSKAQVIAFTSAVSFVKKGQGKLSYAKLSGNKKITINKKTGKVTVAKGLAKGTYKVKAKVNAAGNDNYKASAWKKVTFKVKVA